MTAAKVLMVTAALTIAAAVAGVSQSRTAAPPAAAVNRGITLVPGIRVGQFTLAERPTGCTVVLVEGEGAVGGVSQRGGAPGTRETDLLDPLNMVDRVNAVVLSGGSAYGLDAAQGVVRFLEERGIGWNVGAAGVVPIVPAAILFDLGFGGDPKIRPGADCGYKAATAAANGAVAEGNVGAGAGATVGKLAGAARAMKGGIGSASIALPNGLIVGAIAAVNAAGDVVDPSTGKVVAGVRTEDGKTLADARVLIRSGAIGRGSGGPPRRRQHHDCRRRHQRTPVEGRDEPRRADGRRCARARHQPLAHDRRRRHRVRARHQPVDRRDQRHDRRRAGRGGACGSHRARGIHRRTARWPAVGPLARHRPRTSQIETP